MKHKIKLNIFCLGLALIAQNARADYQAYCVKFTGEHFVQIKIFEKNDNYYQLVGSPNASIIVVKAKTQATLHSLCPDGQLVDHAGAVNYFPEQVTPNQTVSAGYYMANPVNYADQAEYQVRSSNR